MKTVREQFEAKFPNHYSLIVYFDHAENGYRFYTDYARISELDRAWLIRYNARWETWLAAQPSPVDFLRNACMKCAIQHPVVLEIMADCCETMADGKANPIHYQTLEADLRTMAANIRADDPDIWPPPLNKRQPC